MADSVPAKRRKLPADGRASNMEPIVEEREDTSPRKPNLGEFEASARDCISIHLVRTAEEMETAEGFHPEYTHQHFGEDEKIYGYKDLQINIWMHATTFLTYIDVSFSQKVTGRRKKADNITAVLKEHFPAGFTTSKAEFVRQVEAGGGAIDLIHLLHDKGQIVDTWKTDGRQRGSTGSGGNATPAAAAQCELICMELTDAAIRDWHARLQPFVPFFIDNGQPIDSEDPLWELYVVCEKRDGKLVESVVAGFCLVYRFYHHPESTRLRISQMVVLPPYQGKGHGLRMLQAVNIAAMQRQCYDVTVEDPSDELQRLRETVDVLRLLEFPPAVAAAKAAVAGSGGFQTGQAKKPLANGNSFDVRQETVGGGACLNGGHGEEEKALAGDERTVDIKVRSAGGEVREEREDDASIGKEKPGDGYGAETIGVGGSKWGSIPKELIESMRAELKMSKKQALRCWELLLLLLIPEGPKGETQRRLWRMLVQQRLYSEEFGGKKDEELVKHKRIIDIDFVHNDMMMFFMTKAKKWSGNGADAQAEAGEDAEAVKESMSVEERKAAIKEGLQKFMEERMADVEVVVEKVRRHGKELLSSL